MKTTKRIKAIDRLRNMPKLVNGMHKIEHRKRVSFYNFMLLFTIDETDLN